MISSEKLAPQGVSKCGGVLIREISAVGTRDGETFELDIGNSS